MPPKGKTPKKTEKKVAKNVPATNKSTKAIVNKRSSPTIKKVVQTTHLIEKEKKTPVILPLEDVDDVDTPVDEESRKRVSEENISETENVADQQPEAKKIRIAQEDPFKKAIDEIDLEGSSESDYNSYYRQSVKESFIRDAEQLLGTQLFPEEDEEESTEDDAPEYLKQNELEEEHDFFGNIGEIPDVDEVSLDLAVDIVKERPQAMAPLTGLLDVGKFVNPLTGEIILSKPTSEEDIHIEEKLVEVTQQVAMEEEEEEPGAGEEGSVDIPILSDQELEVEPIGVKIVDEEDAFNQFMVLETLGPVELAEEIDVEALAREENARLLRVQTYEFVQYLINRAVEMSEYVDPRIILRQNLDKRKLMKELSEKLALLEIERRGKEFLNRKCVEYFRRKRTFRPIMDDNPKTLNLEVNKYKAAVTNLDQLLIKEEEARMLSQQNLKVIREKLAVEEEKTLEEISNLEEIIKKTLKRENFDKLQLVVTNSLAKMETVRKEISNIRFQLIEKQHNMATLMKQLCDLEDLGNGLSMRNFETIQTETQALGKKIEERNTELNKLRYRCHGDIHRMAHLKEKQKMIRDTITFQRQYLEELHIEKRRLREFLFDLKIERTHLRKHMRDISFQSGLLDKSVLMKDYDATMEHLEALQSQVDQSKATINNLNEKIAVLEKYCDPAN